MTTLAMDIIQAGILTTTESTTTLKLVSASYIFGMTTHGIGIVLVFAMTTCGVRWILTHGMTCERMRCTQGMPFDRMRWIFDVRLCGIVVV